MIARVVNPVVIERIVPIDKQGLHKNVREWNIWTQKLLPVGSPNNFVEISLVATNGSVGFPDVELAPVSLIADRMVPSTIPCISSALDRPFSRCLCFWCEFY